MRAVLTLPTSKTFTADELSTSLAPTTWLPNQSIGSAWVDERIQANLDTLPPVVRRQLVAAPKVFIQVSPSVEGIVSCEREHTVLVRLFAESDAIESIKQAVVSVASRLPAVFTVPGDTNLRLEDDVLIRQSQDGQTVAKGRIVTPHTLKLWTYLRTERRREWKLLAWLVGLGLAAFVVGAMLAIKATTTTWLTEIHGYAERGASAFAVAALTTFINLIFEYRDWRNEQTEVIWLFG